ncbi:4-hydroxyphenylacetate degradation bifunctional isomerase : decarboxylase (divided with OB2865 and OB2866) [Oceanobacillus iheyensis HTE831]|uniref:4-hydroxyphenylacetate degradation bifunctional isomerase: decarboxylase (Divided with OB2865 and OB2866) n=1 Tax=Oceanobacillus iheyensis (strain DSM 14371 / CIP 107618 / JCM 11309 / KCTC 3954 / HTE831) TaxID=221109 RepID=Q8EMH6_OCEIH|nr:fumarylacetoacetate hydrolase family protein [Oceanobacillus iheyensis]BAC14822.1 4-hydroxyphenylacetate degradation bifunctional isomerase : decarboxylase (divided with OB2865 and OB2866) [Oceanobacillus iheyensis HTE831]
MSSVKFKHQGVQQLKEGIYQPDQKLLKFDGKQCSLDDLSLDVPINGTVYGTLLNYKGEYAELESSMNEDPYKTPPKAPILYIKPINTHIGYGMTIPLPEGVEKVSIGAALGVVIGKPAKNIRKENALDYVAGYTIVNDVSIPNESYYRPAYKEKARDGFCPIGPWVLRRDAIENPNELGIRVYINGEIKQENTTSNLIRSVEQLMEEVTDFMTLYEGDVLLVGVPENAPIAKENDRVIIEIDNIGTLVNKVEKEKVDVGGVMV